MYLRKLWSAKLAEWLFGSGVAIACLAPLEASSFVKGGEEFTCSGAQMGDCYDNNTEMPCSNPSGDGSDPTMYEACATIYESGGPGVYTGSNWTCGEGCDFLNHASQGTHCSVNTQNCYY
jgi:hypothetical protein